MTLTESRPRPAVVAAPASPWRDRLRRPLVACALLLVIYSACSLAKDPHAFLGTDEGGKVATLRAMDARGDLSPNLGYWAARLDPKGTLYPIALTDHLGHQWVNVTTLPMLYASYPLYELGGLRAILLLPMLGGVLTALAARALARRLGARGDLAFWLVGLATPVFIYSLDFWEHTLGLAAMAWAIVLLFDVADRRAGWRAALGAGALFGAAATMRTEALVYAVVTVGVVAWACRHRSRPTLARLGAAFVAGVVVPLVANTGLEVLALGGSFRTGRASGAASAGGSDLGARVGDALRTTVGLNGFQLWLDWVLGATIVLAVAVAALRMLRPQRDGRPLGWCALGFAVLLYAVRLNVGLSFLSGMLVASPLAVFGLVVANRRPEFRRPVAVALLALPIVWAFQYGGGAGPQWGGRYELTTGFLLAVVAAVALERAPWRAVVAVVGLAAALTGVSLAWLAVRTHDFARTIGAVAAEPGPIVTTSPTLLHFWREGGAFYTPTRPWLTAPSSADVRQAAALLEHLHEPGFTLVSLDLRQAPEVLGPYRQAGHRSLPLVGTIRVQVVRYRS